MEVLLKEINRTTRNLKDDFVSLNTSIVNVTAQLNTACTTQGGANCSSRGIDPSVLNLNADYTTLPDVEKSLEEIVDINKQNFSQSAQKVSIFNEIFSQWQLMKMLLFAIFAIYRVLICLMISAALLLTEAREL